MLWKKHFYGNERLWRKWNHECTSVESS